MDALDLIPTQQDLLHFLRGLGHARLNRVIRGLVDIITMDTARYVARFDESYARALAANSTIYQKALAWLARSALLLNPVPTKVVSCLCKNLDDSVLDYLFKMLCAKHRSRACLMFDNMKIGPMQFRRFVTAFTSPQGIDQGIINSFRELCLALLRDGHGNHYAECFDKDFPVNHQWCCDVYFQVGAANPGIINELFQNSSFPGSTSSYLMMVRRIVELKLVDCWCPLTVYKFKLPTPPKMTIFEYAIFQKEDGLCRLIVSQPEFRARDHLNVVLLAVRVAKPTIASDFLQYCELGLSELETCVDLVKGFETKSKRKDREHFREIMGILTSQYFEVASRKRAKTVDNEDF